MDVFADVLHSLRLRGSVYCRSEFTAPWGVRFAPSEAAAFHVVEQGSCWLQLEKEEPPLHLTSGDVVVITRKLGHQICDDPTTPIKVTLENQPANVRQECPIIRAGGGGVPTTLICGTFHFERRNLHPLLELLPPLIHIRGEAGKVADWLSPTLAMLAHIAGSQRPGTTTMLQRLSDILFIQVIQVWVEGLPVGVGGWLGALRDPAIGAALGLIHQQPENSWRVESLAKEVGMSRSAFAARFRTLVGEPPLHYLTRWRIHTAVTLMEDSQLKLAEVARRVGYESEAAFSLAFKRATGLAPGTYRQRNRMS